MKNSKKFFVTFTGSRSDSYMHIMVKAGRYSKFFKTPKIVKGIAEMVEYVKHRNDWNFEYDEQGNMVAAPDKSVFRAVIEIVSITVKQAVCEHEWKDETDPEDGMENGTFCMVCEKCGTVSQGHF